jgi:hypothetical protein
MDAGTARLVAQELQLTEPGGRGRVAFHGTSMIPLLREADDVLVAPVAWEDIRPGDVVTFRLDERFPTYRVVRRRRGHLVLRGDNWPAREFHAWPEDVLGRAIARRRGGAWLSDGAPGWRWLRFRALARYRAARVRERLRHVARGPYRAFRRLAGNAAAWVRVDVTASDALGALASIRAARETAPDACLDVRIRAEGLTPALAADLVRLGVSRVIVTVAPAPGASRPLDGIAALTARRRERGARAPAVRVEYPLDRSSYEGLEAVVRTMAAAHVEELALTGPALDEVAASDGGARLRRAVKLSEALRVGLGRATPGAAGGSRFGPDRLVEILT